MLNPIRLSKVNEKAIESVVKESSNPLLTPAKATNIAVSKGLRGLRKQFVKNVAEKNLS